MALKPRWSLLFTFQMIDLPRHYQEHYRAVQHHRFCWLLNVFTIWNDHHHYYPGILQAEGESCIAMLLLTLFMDFIIMTIIASGTICIFDDIFHLFIVRRQHQVCHQYSS